MDCRETYKLFGIYCDGEYIRVIVKMNQCNITGFQFSVEHFERICEANHQNSELTNENINYFLNYKYIGSSSIFTNSLLINPQIMDDYAYLGQTTEKVKEKLKSDFETIMSS